MFKRYRGRVFIAMSSQAFAQMVRLAGVVFVVIADPLDSLVISLF